MFDIGEKSKYTPRNTCSRNLVPFCELPTIFTHYRTVPVNRYLPTCSKSTKVSDDDEPSKFLNKEQRRIRHIANNPFWIFILSGVFLQPFKQATMPPANQNFVLPQIPYSSKDRQMIFRRSYSKVGEIETLAIPSRRRELRRQRISSSRIFRWTTATFWLFVLLTLYGYGQLLGWASNRATRDLIRTSDWHASPPKFIGEPKIVHIIHTR